MTWREECGARSETSGDTLSAQAAMQNQGSPLSKKPLFAQGAMYPSPPASPFHNPGAGQQQQYAPNFSPHGGDRSGPPSPFPSPRFSTPVHSYQPPPRYPRESYGSPRSPWQHTGQHGYTPRQRFNSSRRVGDLTSLVAAFDFRYRCHWLY